MSYVSDYSVNFDTIATTLSQSNNLASNLSKITSHSIVCFTLHWFLCLFENNKLKINAQFTFTIRIQIDIINAGFDK